MNWSSVPADVPCQLTKPWKMAGTFTILGKRHSSTSGRFSVSSKIAGNDKLTFFQSMNLHDTYAHDACSPFACFSTWACVRNLPFQVAHSERDAADNKPPVVYPNPRRRCRALPCVASEKVEPGEVQKYWFVKCSNRTCVIHAMKWLSQEYTRMPCTVATDDFRQATGNHSRPGSTSPRNQPTIDAFAALFQPTVLFSAGGQPIPRILRPPRDAIWKLAA